MHSDGRSFGVVTLAKFRTHLGWRFRQGIGYKRCHAPHELNLRKGYPCKLLYIATCNVHEASMLTVASLKLPLGNVQDSWDHVCFPTSKPSQKIWAFNSSMVDTFTVGIVFRLLVPHHVFIYLPNTVKNFLTNKLFSTNIEITFFLYGEYYFQGKRHSTTPSSPDNSFLRSGNIFSLVKYDGDRWWAKNRSIQVVDGFSRLFFWGTSRGNSAIIDAAIDATCQGLQVGLFVLSREKTSSVDRTNVDFVHFCVF